MDTHCSILPLPALLLALVAHAPARAQAHAGCPTHPATVAAMRGCYRPLVVLAPSAADARLKQQQAILDRAADDMMDRNLLYLPVLAAPARFAPPLDAPYLVLPTAESAALRKRFQVEPDAFAVVLLGEDGGEKLTSDKPVSIDTLNSLIDSMPTRRQEMQRPHSN